MKKSNFWFTFVEIVLVISILVLTSTFAINEFSKNFEKQSILREINLINIKLSDLDKNVWKSITDYSLYLYTWSFYHYTTNTFYKDILNEISFLWWTGTLKTNYIWSSSWSNNAKIFFKNKFLKEVSLSFSGSLKMDFSKVWNYFIKSENTTKLNDIFINYFSQIDENKIIVLTSIKDENENSYTWIIIKNGLWFSREILDNNWNKIDTKIILTFENNWLEANLELTK